MHTHCIAGDDSEIKIKSVEAQIGRYLGIADVAFELVCDGLAYIHSSIKERDRSEPLTALQGLEELEKVVEEARSDVKTWLTKMLDIQDELTDLIETLFDMSRHSYM